GGLEFEIEAATETLAERQPPGFVDAGAKRRMNHKLHAAAFVEKALGDNCALRGNGSEDGTSFKDVLNRLRRAGFIQAALFVQPGDGLRNLRHFGRKRDRRNPWQALADLAPKFGHVQRQLLRACRRFAQPERNRWRRSVRIFDQHAAGFAFHPANAPRSVAKKYDVAGVALDGKIFVEGSYNSTFGFSNYRKQRSLRNCPAASDCRQSCPAAGAQLAIHT